MYKMALVSSVEYECLLGCHFSVIGHSPDGHKFSYKNALLKVQTRDKAVLINLMNETMDHNSSAGLEFNREHSPVP